MPIYEYACPNCEKTIEALQKISEPPLTTCPDCGGAVTRLISKTSFQLKGTGWYATDYKKTQSSPAPVKETSVSTEPVAKKEKGTAGGGSDSGPKGD